MESIEQHWRKRFEGYACDCEDEANISGWLEHGFRRRLFTFARIWKKYVDANRSRHLLALDIGCGAGSYCRLINDSGVKVIGMDYSLPSLLRARQFDGSRRILYVVGDIYNPPFKDDKFDVLLCVEVFQTLSDPGAALASLYRVLKPNSITYLMTLNRWNLLTIIKQKVSKISMLFVSATGQSREHGLLPPLEYSPFGFCKLATKTGFAQIGLSWVFIFPSNLEKLESILERFSIFRFLERIPLFPALFARSFILSGQR